MTSNPASVSKGPTSSTRLPFGLYLPCPQQHGYCLGCLRQYLQSKLAEGKTGTLIFPIRCPECPVGAWSFEDQVAARILDGADIVQWVRMSPMKKSRRIHRGDSTPKSCSIPSRASTALTSAVLFVLKSRTTARNRGGYVRLVPRRYASPAGPYGTVVRNVSITFRYKLIMP